jgi:hypothetical protein
LNHFANPDFWFHYRRLLPEIRAIADEKFRLLKADPHHPSLQLKKVGVLWSVRVTLNYRALAKDRPEGLVWYWIGAHSEYERLISAAK